MLSHLSSKELQDVLGTEYFERLTNFIELLESDSSGLNNLSLYTKKNLIKMVLTTSDIKTLKSKIDWVSISSSDFLNKKGVEQLINNELSKYGLPHISEEDELTLLDPEFQILRKNYSVFKVLKDYQQEVCEEAFKELENPLSRFIIQMPTGSGKTRTAMEIIAKHLNDNGDDACVLWLAHSSELVEQAGECFKEIWFHLGQSDIEFGYVDSKRNGLAHKQKNKRFFVATLQKMHSVLLKGDVHETLKPSLIIIDEAHKVIAKTYKNVVETFAGLKSQVIGLTATPGRSVSDEFQNDQLAKFFFNKIIKIKGTNNSTTIDYLREQGVLAKAKLESIQGANIVLTANEINRFKEHIDIPTSILSRVADEELRNLEILIKIKELLHNHQSILLFACSIEHSKFITSICNYLGVVSAHIDGSTDKNQRRLILKNFKDNKISLLSNYGVLSTGFDAPKVDAIIIARPTSSIVLFSQMIGRGLRGPVIGGTEFCTIVNVIDNITGLPSESNIYQYFDDYWSEE